MITPNTTTQQAFDQWTNASTWATGHWCDDQRFYDFVHAAHAETLTVDTLRDLLQSKIKDKYTDWTESRAGEAISCAVIRFEELIGFLNHIGYKKSY